MPLRAEYNERSMRIRYETGVATLIQLAITAGLSFISAIASIIAGCRGGFSADCVTNAFVSLVLIIMMIVGLGILLALGYAAQARRSVRLAYTLMGAEAFAALVFLFDAKQAPGIVERLTNFVSFLVAAWVIFIAWRLSRAKGGRMVTRQSRRRAA